MASDGNQLERCDTSGNEHNRVSTGRQHPIYFDPCAPGEDGPSPGASKKDNFEPVATDSTSLAADGEGGEDGDETYEYEYEEEEGGEEDEYYTEGTEDGEDGSVLEGSYYQPASPEEEEKKKGCCGGCCGCFKGCCGCSKCCGKKKKDEEQDEPA